MRDARGFTLIEVLLAVALLTIGLLGVGAAVTTQMGGISSSITVGQAAINRGYYVSTATFLAQEWMEQLKGLTYSSTTDQLTNPPSGYSTQDYGSISGYANFKRSVTVTDSSPATNIKTITVTITYRLPTASGSTEESLTVTTLRAQRPS
jgi:prepilin-type N-terminal cleavage/methylation domain-containing protein